MYQIKFFCQTRAFSLGASAEDSRAADSKVAGSRAVASRAAKKSPAGAVSPVFYSLHSGLAALVLSFCGKFPVAQSALKKSSPKDPPQRTPA